MSSICDLCKNAELIGESNVDYDPDKPLYCNLWDKFVSLDDSCGSFKEWG